VSTPPPPPATQTRDRLAWVLLAWTIATAVFAWHLSLTRTMSLPGFDPGFLARWLPILGFGALIGTSAIGCGSLLAKFVPLPRMSWSATLATRFFVGCGLVSVLMAIIHGLSEPGDPDSLAYDFAWVAHVPFACFGAYAIARVFRERTRIESARSLIERIAFAALIVILGMSFLSAMSPPIQSDGLRYHLLGPQEWSSHGFMHYIPYNAFTNLPSMLGLLTTAAWPHAAVFTLLHWMSLVATVVLAGECAAFCARAASPGTERDARAAAQLLALGIPVLIIVGAWPFSDIAAAGACVAIIAVGLAAFEAEAPARGTAAWMGLLAGTAVAAKLSAGPMVAVIGIGWMIWWVRRRAIQRTMLPAIALFCALSIVPLLPYFLRNFENVGNPVYPVLAGKIGKGEWTAECAALYALKVKEKGYGKNPVALALSPFTTTLFWLTKFEGQSPGPSLVAVLILAIPFGLRGKREGAPKRLLLGMFAGLWIAWFVGYQSGRFLLVPILVATSLAGAAWAVEWRDRGRGLIVGVLPALLAIPGALWSIQWSTWTYASPPVLSAFADEDEIIARAFPTYATLLTLQTERTGTDDIDARFRSDKVFYIGEHRGAYAERFTPVHSDWFDTPRILPLMRTTKTDEELRESIRTTTGAKLVLVNLRESRIFLQRGFPDAYMGLRYTPEEYKRLLEFIAGELYPRRVVGDDVTFVADLTREPDGPPMSLDFGPRNQ
jgi:hypothetical protein